ncbi:MAG: SCP2 sterol-binding domain-containing protein [Lachnospiraceae bacterium]|nr:SCP2 sterol-binding domain-containing protein [Lachnospiraceae bacterium]
MKVNIYYGGRGLMDDPTLYVINKMQEVLEELNVKVERFMLNELKNTITTLPQTLKEADGIILAATVEWYGIGGYMQQFLDACWLYGDKEKIAKIYMCPVVMSTTYGEREGKMTLSVAWEILGGLPCSGICGYIANINELEMSDDYRMLIERKAENVYRTIKQKVVSLPASNRAVQQKVSLSPTNDLTPQETEQLSQYAADDGYVQRQKEDIQELASMFRGMMSQADNEADSYQNKFEKNFQPIPGFKAVYKIAVEGNNQAIGLQINGKDLIYHTDFSERADVEAQITADAMNEIMAGRMTFQRAFMGGEMKMKGDFKILRTLDELFVFMKE